MIPRRGAPSSRAEESASCAVRRRRSLLYWPPRTSTRRRHREPWHLLGPPRPGAARPTNAPSKFIKRCRVFERGKQVSGAFGGHCDAHTTTSHGGQGARCRVHRRGPGGTHRRGLHQSARSVRRHDRGIPQVRARLGPSKRGQPEAGKSRRRAGRRRQGGQAGRSQPQGAPAERHGVLRARRAGAREDVLREGRGAGGREGQVRNLDRKVRRSPRREPAEGSHAGRARVREARDISRARSTSTDAPVQAPVVPVPVARPPWRCWPKR